jgi:uncharacterized protein YbaR (Trm112 family)
MSFEGLKAAIEDILICPACKGSLSLANAETGVECLCCHRAYPIKEGIPVFLGDRPVAQAEERRFRDTFAAEHIQKDGQVLLELVAQHHCVSVMRKRAEVFRARLKPHQWLLDIGIGFGWHWLEQGEGAPILGVDMSLGNLSVARRLLEGNNFQVVLICADAATLPIRQGSISGLWSVQAFQHFPAPVLRDVLKELDRVLTEAFVIEIHNLNPALLLRAVYRLFGKQLHRGGKTAHMELNRLSTDEWSAVWQQFKSGKIDIRCGYSELFFHPDLRVRPRRYPVKLEQVLAAHAPSLAALFARQVWTEIRPKPLQASA